MQSSFFKPSKEQVKSRKNLASLSSSGTVLKERNESKISLPWKPLKMNVHKAARSIEEGPIRGLQISGFTYLQMPEPPNVITRSAKRIITVSYKTAI